MARIESKDYNNAQLGNIEKLNGDFFIKTIQADKQGNFISPFAPAEYDELSLVYSGTIIDKVVYKLSDVIVCTLQLIYSGSQFVGIKKI